jgi:hypothetical protein
MFQSRYFAFTAFVLILLSSLPYTLHAHDNEYVHPYIAEQAFWVWPKDTSHEIYRYLCMGLRMPCGDNPACYIYMCGISGDGGLITEGANEEDWFDPLQGYCNVDVVGTIGFNHHFYDPDVQSGDNGLCSKAGAVAYAQTYWDLAVGLYQNQNARGQAYWYLGRIAHLLADVSVPAHVHRDPHCSLLLNPDSYEDYMKSNSNYLKWSSSSVETIEPINSASANWGLGELFYQIGPAHTAFPK